MTQLPVRLPRLKVPFPVRIPSRINRGFLFVLPTALMLLVVLGFPIVVAIINSFSTPEGGWTLENYARLPGDQRFRNALGVTFTFVAGTVLLHFVVGFIIALALNSEVRGKRFFRVIAILPWTVPDVISGLIWRFMYNPTAGIINRLLFDVGLTHQHIEWLGDSDLALPSVIFADVWRGYPFVMLILLAGLQAISRDLYEAAKVDGAGPVQEFRYVTLPGMRGMILIAIALDTIWQFRRFGLVFNMTAGGPGNVTEILSLYVYKQYFRYFNFEYAAAIAVVLAIIMLLLSIPYVRAMVRRL
jgi:multiple sugar transport system permease protein